MLSEKQARTICETMLGFVTADDAVVSVSGEDYSHLRFAANQFTTSGRRQNTSVSATVWVEGRRGSAAVNETDEDALRSVVRQAEEIARLSPVDREYLPTLGPQKYTPVAGYVEATANISLAARAKAINDVLSECERAKVAGAGFHQARGLAGGSATKNGNFEFERSSLISLGLTARTSAGDGSGYFLRSHYDAAKLDTGRVAREAIRKALESREPQTVEPGAYPVVLEPQAVADLLGGLGFAFNARTADEGRSAFSAPGGKTKLGQQVFDKRINIRTDPWHPELPGSASAQDGLPAKSFHLVRNGVLETLVYNRYWAKLKEKEPTPGPVNSIMESSEKPATVEEMIRATERGILVGRFWYIRPVDPRTLLITGLTRDGIWWIEGGKIKHPIRNFRFNQSLLELLAEGNVEMIGAPERVGSSEGQGRNAFLLPALKVKRFHFTSPSDAV
jgi:predicted Zn-dependent protease